MLLYSLVDFGPSIQMSQQQPQQRTKQQVGGQAQQAMGGQPQQMAGQQQQQAPGVRLQDVQGPQERAAVDALVRAIEVCEFCAEQCIQLGDPNMTECIRLCEDVSELGEVALTLIPRNSRYTQDILRTFEQAAQACAQECGRHMHSHCQECATVLGQTLDTIKQFSQSKPQQVQYSQQTGMQQAGQFGQQAGSQGQQSAQLSQQPVSQTQPPAQ